MSRFVALIALLLAACQPFYRDNLRAAQRVEDSSKVNKLLDDADRAANAGDLKRASELAYDAIRENPSYSTRGYVILAMAFTRAGNASAASKAIALGQKHFGSSMTSAMFDAYAREDRIADALDYIKATTFSDAKRYSAGQLTQLANADDAKTTDEAMRHYLEWRAVYGVPDHAALRDAVDRITKRIGDDIDHRTPLGKRLLAIGPHADAASARGDVAGALTLYALAERILPANKFVHYRAAMARTAAKVTDVSAIDPVASNFALDGDAALKAGKIPAAIHAYRLAVAHAPWWSNAHGNLAELLVLAGHPGEAALERVWTSGLAAGGWETETATAPPTDLDDDGVFDPGDQCPYRAEDKDGFNDTDGCPDPDNDRDGLADEIDKCPTETEDKDGFQDDDGCPDPDNDRDGVPDLSDACPTQPETINGAKDTDGCPDEGRVINAGSELRLLDPIEFDKKSAKLAKSSSMILDALVATLAGNPSLQIEIGVHGNILGKPDLDTALTQARANAIMKYLVDHKIAPARLTATGYGDSKPLDPGADAKSLAKNRRVELLTVAVPTTTACDADALKDKGMEYVNLGNHEAALQRFEESLKCKQDGYVLQLAFLASCNGGDVAKARHYYPKLTATQQTRFKVTCTRNNVDVDSPPPGDPNKPKHEKKLTEPEIRAKLAELDKLLEKQLITPAEYEQKKKALLDQL